MPSSAKTSNFEIMGINRAKHIFLETATREYPDYKIDEHNKRVIEALLLYFTNKPGFEDVEFITNPSLQKGILLAGNIGTGKTLLMTILRNCYFPHQAFGIKSCRDISQRFATEGMKGIEIFGSRAVKFEYGRQRINNMMFDDLGAEKNMAYYGNTVNVMQEILLDRYEHFVRNGLLTHLTTNLDLNEIEAVYGSRVASRMHEMFNFVMLGGDKNAKDRRVY